MFDSNASIVLIKPLSMTICLSSRYFMVFSHDLDVYR